MTLLPAGAKGHRRILEEYDPYLLDQMIAVVAACNAGGLHHLLREPRDDDAYFGTDWLVLTMPFPIYGIFRYLYLVHRKRGGGHPVGSAVDGSAVALVRRALGPHSDRHHLSAVRFVRGIIDNDRRFPVLKTSPATVLRDYHR